jgi:DNA-binding XRE family transcriptional regulator
MSQIKEARVRAGLTAAEVASAVGRNPTTFSSMESGMLPVPPEHERNILLAIDRLARFNETVRTAKATLTHDLRLPPIVPTRGHPQPGGKHAA